MYDGDVIDRDTGADSDVRRLAIWWLTGVVVCLPGPVGLSMAVVNLMRGDQHVRAQMRTHALAVFNDGIGRIIGPASGVQAFVYSR